MPQSRSIPTTTLMITKPSSYHQLEASYQLLRYELPRDLPCKLTGRSDLWGRMQNNLRGQLNYPYRVFTHDKLDGKTTWVVYVLAPCASALAPTTPLTYDDAPLPLRQITFEELEFHLLVKLLQRAHMQGNSAGRFTGQGNCYIHAKKKGDSSHICAQIELHYDIKTKTDQVFRHFKVEAQAKLVRRYNDPKSSSGYAYFGKRLAANGAVYFLQLKSEEIAQAKAQKEPVFGLGVIAGTRTTLAYHDLDHIDASVGKILSDFTRDFRNFLAQFGIESQSHVRTFTQFDAPKEEDLCLDLALLNPISVFDKRKNKTIPPDDYFQLLQKMRPDMTFTTINDLAETTKPILVLQDYQKEDFLSGGIFYGENDPYGKLYQEHRDLPKQSLTVNFLDAKKLTVDAYLSYPLPEVSQLQRKLDVSLAQLYLKAIVCSKDRLSGRLPFLPPDLLYVRKLRNIPGLKEPFETMMYVEDDYLHFLDLRDFEQRSQAIERCEQLGIDWIACQEQMIAKYKREDREESERAMPSYNVIVGPDLFVEIEDCKERVLYDYEEIVRRQDAVKIVFPVETFKLLPHYDEVKNEANLSLKELQRRGLLDGRKRPTLKKEEDSLHFYQQLVDYDAYLDEIQEEYPELSFEQLTDDEKPCIDQIHYIFQINACKNGKITNSKLIERYQKRGWSLSDKARDVHMYEDIWYDNDHCYMVGAAQGIKRQQPRAHLIRRFDVYQGQEHFDIQPLLRMMSVQFVRLKQYTVFPYPFHLIDLYVENVLRFCDQHFEEERLLITALPSGE